MLQVSHGIPSRHLASGSRDKTVIVWDTATGEKARHLRRHTSGIASVTWSANDMQLASWSWDKTIILWDTMIDEPMRQLQVNYDNVESVVWSSDGRQLALGSWDDTIKIYPPGYLELPCQWVRANFTFDEWLTLRGRIVYRPTCPQFSSPSPPSIVESLRTNPDYLFLSVQGWLFLSGIVLVFVAVVALLIWVCIRLIHRFVYRRRSANIGANV